MTLSERAELTGKTKANESEANYSEMDYAEEVSAKRACNYQTDALRKAGWHLSSQFGAIGSEKI